MIGRVSSVEVVSLKKAFTVAKIELFCLSNFKNVIHHFMFSTHISSPVSMYGILFISRFHLNNRFDTNLKIMHVPVWHEI